MLAYQQIYPATSKPEDVWAAKQVQEFLNFNIYDADTGRGYSLEVMQYAKNHGIEMDITDEDKEIMKKAKADFLAFSYYSSWVLSSNKIPEGEAPNRYPNKGGVESKYVKTNDWGWAIDPQDLGMQLLQCTTTTASLFSLLKMVLASRKLGTASI